MANRIDSDTQKLPRTVLVVESDEGLRSLLRSSLEVDGYVVLEASDAQEGLVIASNSDVDAVVSASQMPSMDGLTFLKKVKRQVVGVPFVLVVAANEAAAAQRALDLGAVDVLTTPFETEDLLACLDFAIGSKREIGAAEFESLTMEMNFCRLSAEEYVSLRSSESDVFVRLSSNKFLKVANKGLTLSFERVQAYKRKGVEFLYLRKKDFANHVGFQPGQGDTSVINIRVPKARRVKLLDQTGKVIVQDTHVPGVRSASFESAKRTVEETLSTMLEDRELFSLIERVRSHSPHLFAHSLGVATYACLAAKEAGWTSASAFFRLSMAGLLHDIGKVEVPADLLVKPRTSLTSEEQSIYDSHSLHGESILSQIKSVPQEVRDVAANHHEVEAVHHSTTLSSSGTEATGEALHYPLTHLVVVADEFCKLVLKNPKGDAGVPVQDALHLIYAARGTDMDPVFVRVMLDLFAVSLPNGHTLGKAA